MVMDGVGKHVAPPSVMYMCSRRMADYQCTGNHVTAQRHSSNQYVLMKSNVLNG